MPEARPKPERGRRDAAVRLLRLIEELGAASGEADAASRAAVAARHALSASAAAVLLGEGPELRVFADGSPGASAVAVPLAEGATRLGELKVSARRPIDEALLEAVGAACALAISRGRAADRARGRARLLAEASALEERMAAAEALQNLAQLVVPELADFCTIDLLDGSRPDPPVAAHRDPKKAWLLRNLGRQRAAKAGDERWLSAIAAGKPALYSELTEPALAAMAGSDAAGALLRELGPTSVLAVPIFAAGEVRGALSLGMAGSGRRLGEDELPIAQELARRAGRLLDRAAAQDRFAALAAHELKTPLTSLKLSVQSAGRMAQALPESEGKPVLASRLDVAERQIDRLAALVDRLLEVARATRGELALDLRDTDLCAAIRSAAARAADELAGAGCELHLELPAELRGRWDPARLEQMAALLLENAIKFGPRRPIRIAAGARDGLASFSVEDGGIGIAPADQQRLFAPFERAVPVGHFGGFGAGLFLVREIATALGGTVRVESGPAQGATFTVELPR